MKLLSDKEATAYLGYAPKSENDRVKELLDISDRARKYFYARDVNKELSVAEVADIKSKAREFGKRLLELGDS